MGICCICYQILWSGSSLCSVCRNQFLNLPLITRELGRLTAFSLFHHEDLLAQRMRGLKGGKTGHGLVRELVGVLLSKIPWGETLPSCVLPAPPRKLGEKDHAWLVANAAAEALGLPLEADLLRRKTEREQKGRSFQERQKVAVELENNPKFLSPYAGGVVLIVDDVITTGATLLGCWRALERPPAWGLSLASRPFFR